MKQVNLLRDRHIKYFLRILSGLPSYFHGFDCIRMTILHFTISGLDVLNAVDKINDETKRHIIDWIYHLQVVNDEVLDSGFQGSSTLISTCDNLNDTQYQCSHLASTYCALCVLVILEDDLSRVNRKAIIRSIKALQLPDGSYPAMRNGSENDMRFLYCAACISFILDDWSGIDMERAKNYIIKSIGFDCGIGQGPELESHGGSTYCALGTLVLTNQLSTLSSAQKSGLRRWLLQRQESGFNGRPNKLVDTCYSFWVGASLKMLDFYEYINVKKLREFVIGTQDGIVGGFSKAPDSSPDPLHSFLGLAGLSIMGEDELNEVVPELGITKRAYKHLQAIKELTK